MSFILLEQVISAKQSLPPPFPPLSMFLFFPHDISAKLHAIIGVINFAGQSNNRTMDTSGSTSNAVGRKEIETVQPLDKTGVDESCIMVNGAELHFHHQREGKHKPYQVF